jgi:VanZ family protein
MHKSQTDLSWRMFIPAILWFFLVLFLLCLPGEDLPPMNNWFQYLHIDKLVHGFLFLVMAYLFMAPPGRADFPAGKKMITFIAIGVAVCLWGLATEFIQKHFVAGRRFEFTDWVSDSCGSLLAVFIARFRFR